MQIRNWAMVAGAGRSGTTWLGKIIDSSSRVLYRHEPDNLRRLSLFRGIPDRLEREDEAPELRERFLRGVERAGRTHHVHFHRPPEFPKDFVNATLWKGLGLGLRAARKVGWTPLVPLPGTFFGARARQATLVLKSVVSNLRLAWIHDRFQEARTVFILRHPGGYLNSWKRGVEKHGWSGFGSPERLAGVLLPFPRPEHARFEERFEAGTDFERELIYWLVANEVPWLELADSPRLKVVVYEDLCRRPMEVAREVFAFLELPWEPQSEDFVRRSTETEKAGYHSVFKSPAVAANRWRELLPADEIELVERELEASPLGRLWEGL